MLTTGFQKHFWETNCIEIILKFISIVVTVYIILLNMIKNLLFMKILNARHSHCGYIFKSVKFCVESIIRWLLLFEYFIQIVKNKDFMKASSDMKSPTNAQHLGTWLVGTWRIFQHRKICKTS